MEHQDTSPPRRRRRTAALVAGALGIAAAAAVVTGVAVADPPASSSGTTIYACVGQHNGQVRIVAAGTACRPDEDATSWNTTGPQGSTGPAGPAGPQGPAGAPAPDTTPRAKVVGHMTLTPEVGSPLTFDIYAYSAAQQQSATIGAQSGGAGAGKVTFQPITVTKPVDASSPRLLVLLGKGVALKSAEVQLLAPDGSIAETVNLKLVLLTSLTTSNSGAATDRIHEDLSLDAGSIAVTVGSTTGSWDRTRNTGG